MKRVIKYSDVKNLENIRTDIINEGKSYMCPAWSSYCDGYKDKCTICAELFPRVKDTVKCPCHCYKPKYLIRRLTEIINFNKE